MFTSTASSRSPKPGTSSEFRPVEKQPKSEKEANVVVDVDIFFNRDNTGDTESYVDIRKRKLGS